MRHMAHIYPALEYEFKHAKVLKIGSNPAVLLLRWSRQGAGYFNELIGIAGHKHHRSAHAGEQFGGSFANALGAATNEGSFSS
jgi:hypothetical protein